MVTWERYNGCASTLPSTVNSPSFPNFAEFTVAGVSAVFLPLISERRGAGRRDAEGGGLARGHGLIHGLRDDVGGACPIDGTRVGVAATAGKPERNKKACEWKS